ncbi:hypothetical protein VTJ04DRAFT_4782 [Mycothermus thermophilus]|uniref:uncharacterized protein n=1 Tax=Humicola insolens TaxID=85995 RepID=UPI0037436DCC
MQYGFLYDVSVEIASTEQSTVLEILDDRACTTVLYPGSRLLFVAHVNLHPQTVSRPLRNGHVRQGSDELIEDLERELGGVLTEYVEVRVRYCHSAFLPRHAGNHEVGLPPNGVVRSHTLLKTTGVAAIRRCNADSPWSLPSSSTAPRPNRLFEIVAAHWGVENAHAVMQRVIRSRAGIGPVVQSHPMRPSPAVNPRRAQLPRWIQPRETRPRPGLGTGSKACFARGVGGVGGGGSSSSPWPGASGFLLG